MDTNKINYKHHLCCGYINSCMIPTKALAAKQNDVKIGNRIYTSEQKNGCIIVKAWKKNKLVSSTQMKRGSKVLTRTTYVGKDKNKTTYEKVPKDLINQLNKKADQKNIRMTIKKAKTFKNYGKYKFSVRDSYFKKGFLKKKTIHIMQF